MRPTKSYVSHVAPPPRDMNVIKKFVKKSKKSKEVDLAQESRGDLSFAEIPVSTSLNVND
jgi:hypothetical protein